jgi:hypothetical protein
MATIEEIAAGLRSGTPVQKPTTATQTFDPKYINSYGGLVSGATNPNLAANLNKYGTVTDAYGNPIFDQNTLSSYYSDPSALDKSTKAISNVAGKAIQTTLGTWADEVLQKETLDPVTGNPVNWVGGTSGKQYQAAKTALINNPANNARWSSQKTQAQTIADQAVADAKTQEDARIAAVALASADAEAAAATEKTAQEKAATEQAAADVKTAQQWTDVKKPLDTSTLGGGFDATGKPIPVVAPITQGMIDTAKQGVNTVTSDITKMTDAAKIAEVNVTPNSMVSNQLSGLLAKNNPYIQQAVNAANLQASRRGMLNTGAAAGFAQDAAIKAALPIAQGDAQTIARANEANALAANNLQNNVLNLKANGLMADAKEINAISTVYQQAQLNDLLNGANETRKLNELVTQGNITAYNQVSKGLIDTLVNDKSAQAQQSLAIVNSTLERDNKQFQAGLDFTIKQAEFTQKDREALQGYINNRTTAMETAFLKIDTTADISAVGKAALKNNAKSEALENIKNYAEGMGMYANLTKSSAGITASKLVAPPSSNTETTTKDAAKITNDRFTSFNAGG